ncbi:MAG: replication-relaxation family protein [Limisphaerales bacterium]
MQIIRHVFKHRFLTSRQILMLVGGSPQQLLRRLQLLYHHSFLDRPKAQIDYYHRGGSHALIYGIGHRGAKMLEDSFGVPRRKVDWTAKNQNSKRLFLEHTILIADVMIGLELASRKNSKVRLIEQDTVLAQLPAKFRKDADVCRWSVNLRHQQKSVQLPAVPDKVFGLQSTDDPQNISYFLLEADCGSMPVIRSNLNQSSFYRKLLAYHSTWKQGVFKDSLRRFRVLTVTAKPGRLETLISAAGRLPDGQGLFLFFHKGLFAPSADILNLLTNRNT